MAMKIWGVYDAENNRVTTLQGKRRDTMEGAVQDLIRDGSLPYGDYTVRMIAKEGN